jgi:hypothetical protein
MATKRKPLDRGERFVRAVSRLKLEPGRPYRLHSWWEDITRRLFGTVDPETALRRLPARNDHDCKEKLEVYDDLLVGRGAPALRLRA